MASLYDKCPHKKMYPSIMKGRLTSARVDGPATHGQHQFEGGPVVDAVVV